MFCSRTDARIVLLPPFVTRFMNTRQVKIVKASKNYHFCRPVFIQKKTFTHQKEIVHKLQQVRLILRKALY